MKLLYIGSWHTTQTWDDLTLFTELGIDWFDTSIYRDPQNPLKHPQYLIRSPILDKEVNQPLLQEFLSVTQPNSYFSFPNLTLDFIGKFDIILYNFCSPLPNGIQTLVEFVKDRKPIIFRTYGHQPRHIEESLRIYRKKYKLLLIRNSPMERNLINYAGEDEIIRGYIDENIYSGWVGNINSILTFSNDFIDRIKHKNYESYRLYLKYIKDFLPAELYGINNSNVKNSRAVSWKEQLELYRSRACYLNLSSPPASLTYSFAEALMTGMPTVSVGIKLGQPPDSTTTTYEIPELITNEKNGFYSDSPEELIYYLKLLLENEKLRNKIGAESRKLALTNFSKARISQQWIDFFETV